MLSALYSRYVIYNEIDKYNKTHSLAAKTTVDDLKKDSRVEKKKNQKDNDFLVKDGGMEQADKDFDSLGPSGVESNGTRVGYLPDGSTEI